MSELVRKVQRRTESPAKPCGDDQPPHSLEMNTPYTVALVLLVLLLGAGFAFDGGEEESAQQARPPAGGVRGSGGDDHRRGSSGSGACASRRARARRGQPGAGKARRARRPRPLLPRRRAPRRRGGLKLLGLLEPRVDLRDVSATVFGQGVAGYYDPRTKRLRIVRGAQTTNPFLEEITLAHELTHALEDQRFGLDLEDSSGSDDAALARLALVEGSATAVMFDLRRAPLLRRTDPRRAVREPRPGHRRPAAVRGGAAAVPVPHRPALRRARCTRPATTAGRWSTRPTASARPPPPSRSCTPRSTSRSSSRAACVSTWTRAGGGAGGERASGTWGEWATGELLADRPGGGLGRRPLRALAAARRRLPGAVPPARRARHALALGHAPRRPRVRDRAARVAAAAAGAERGRRTRPRGHARPRPGRRARAAPGPGLACPPGPVAQRLEPRTHNPSDGGSNPPRPIGPEPNWGTPDRGTRPDRVLDCATERAARVPVDPGSLSRRRGRIPLRPASLRWPDGPVHRQCDKGPSLGMSCWPHARPTTADRGSSARSAGVMGRRQTSTPRARASTSRRPARAPGSTA